MILNNYLTSMKVLVIGLFLFVGSVTSALAQETDTSFDDLDFTEIGSAADTAAIATVTNLDSLKKADSAVSVSDTTKNAAATAADVKSNTSETEKTLWETFIAGLVGGFLAFLMPCIFP